MDTYFSETANQNAPISFFAQLLKYLPQAWIFDEDKRLSPRSNARQFTFWDQLVCLLFCHLAGCDSLREIEDGLISAVGKLQHASAKAMGRTTLAYANEHRSYEIAKSLYFRLLQTYAQLFKGHLDQDYLHPVYALDSTTISVCLSRFQWARYRRAKGGFKLHTVLDEDLQLPVVMNMTHGKRADVKEAKTAIEALGSKDITVVMDRGYNDYKLFHRLNWRIKYIWTVGGLSANPGFASQCRACGACEKKCPQGLPIIKLLQTVRRQFEFPLMIPVLRLIGKVKRRKAERKKAAKNV